MTDIPLAHLLFAALTFLLAGLVKGTIGLGLPTVAIGLLGLVMSPAQAAALLIVPSLITNVWQLVDGRGGSSVGGIVPLLWRLWPMMAGICAGTWAGAGLLTGAGGGGGATATLGGALMLYAAVGLMSVRFAVPVRAEPFLSPLIGAATGLVTAATGVFVIPAVPYLQALGLEKDDLVQALGLSFMVSTVALAADLANDGAFLIRDGAFQASLAGVSLVAVGASLGGMFLGQRLRTRVDAATFRFWFFVGLLALGGHFALRAVL